MARSEPHIIELLETTPVTSMSESVLQAIHHHVATCSACRTAFEAAQISSVLLSEGAGETFEPSPFFQTRVMALVREQQATPVWSLSRLWRAAGALASSMAATVVILGALTFAMPGNQVTSSQELTAGNAYSAEAVILNQPGLDELASDGQVLTTLYGAEEDAVK